MDTEGTFAPETVAEARNALFADEAAAATLRDERRAAVETPRRQALCRVSREVV